MRISREFLDRPSGLSLVVERLLPCLQLTLRKGRQYQSLRVRGLEIRVEDRLRRVHRHISALGALTVALSANS